MTQPVEISELSRPAGVALSRWRWKRWLRDIDSVGNGIILKGRPQFINQGRIVFGKHCYLSSHPVQSHIAAMPDSVINIGDRVLISYGAAISAQRSIQIGDDTKIGPFCVIMDSDFHRPGNRDAAGEVAPVRIGARVAIGPRVTILRSADIGDGARILGGSMVSGVVPADAIVGGVPARVVGESLKNGILDIPDLVQRVLGTADRPGPNDGPRDIPEWDSLGTLRLLLAIEEAYGISVREEDVQAAKTVAALAATVDQAKERARIPRHE